jgi:hypothetical protein
MCSTSSYVLGFVRQFFFAVVHSIYTTVRMLKKICEAWQREGEVGGVTPAMTTTYHQLSFNPNDDRLLNKSCFSLLVKCPCVATGCKKN